MESPPRITELIMLGDPLRPGLLRDLNGPEGHEIAAPMDGIRYLYMSSTYLPRCIIPAYANLAELRLSHVDRSSTILPQLEEILRSCHQLVFLRATNVGGSDSKAPFHSRGSVKMCSLRTIEIFDAYDASVAYFLSTLVAPVLEVLRIQAKTFFYRNGQIASYIGQPLAIFLATSNPHLQNLSLDAVEILQDDLVPVLQLLPHISSLRLSRMFGAARFLETLTSERLCPQLKLLVIANMTHDRPTISVPLRTLIQPEDRLPLQRLVVQGCKHFDPPHIAWLSANAPNFRLLP
ncbi:hypothetical protein BOTBODRAFT_41534 [Botryobasidium botryosum FD-172 SS1]|uniref:F-box domain-containing protein n=1 Tax=Botryobasidium botryosum (strain FD-172 SS1) TaxID=930990 RepID=A0A067MUG0_BOTB1|nr:hypothetical protein BOTBODRAFT_41534 [Botryobasidium botryosum FD-172 SS1]